MTWFAFHGYPDINAAGVEEKELVAARFHGYATKAEADANPNSVMFGPQSFLLDSLQLSHQTNPAGTGIAGLGGASPLAGANPLSGVSAIGDFFSRLTNKNTWVRVGEFVAGALILYVGLKAIVAPEGQRVAARTTKDTVASIASKVK
jgi:hypothetical protein